MVTVRGALPLLLAYWCGLGLLVGLWAITNDRMLRDVYATCKNPVEVLLLALVVLGLVMWFWPLVVKSLYDDRDGPWRS